MTETLPDRLPAAGQRGDGINADLTVIMPAFNEAKAIALVIADLNEHLPGCEIIVIDDASSDGTAEVAANEGATVVSLAYNHGYGGALRCGMLKARGDLIAWFDSDHEHRAEDLARMVEILRARRLAAVFGERDGSASKLRSTGKLAIRIVAWLLGLGYVRDFNCGLRVFRAGAVLQFLLLLPSGFSASATSTFYTLRANLPFAFESITLRPRIGHSTVRWLDGPRTIISLLRIASVVKPLRLFALPGLLLIVAGMAYGIVIALAQGLGFPVFGVISIVTGILMNGIGILADQISQLRIQHNAGWARTAFKGKDIV